MYFFFFKIIPWVDDHENRYSAEIDKSKHMMRIEDTKEGRIHSSYYVELIQFIVRNTLDDEHNN